MSPGIKAVNMNGAASPKPTNVNIKKMMIGPCVKAKASAVPKKGAEQGVDNMVARTPFKKSPNFPFVCIEPNLDPPGVENSNNPNIFKLKIKSPVDITIIKIGD